ncbi:MAG: DUF3748 domain-containing protein [Nonlabens ulvanivorans]|uniref:DUF3748 domain-containing protein n=1 Tax=Maribacter litoralis TaxID=2059726 RepID=UPI00329732CF
MSGKNLFTNLKEIQLTNDLKGHFIHTNDSFSPDNNWLVYDTRNDDTHIARTGSIEMINVNTLEIRQLYNTRNQTKYGPGVGAVAFNPNENRVVFIHGLLNCNEQNPYSFSRRTADSILVEKPQQTLFLDARTISPPFTPGALRGGTHAHSWSPDGTWLSFTYNDEVISNLPLNSNEFSRDLRMVGVMAPLGPIKVEQDDEGENVNGEMFSVIVTDVHDSPKFGGNQIDRAYGDGWVGNNGYVKANGQMQKRAVAFLGDTKDKKGNKLTELFVVDIPDDISKSRTDALIEGTKWTRPNPPLQTKQRKVTFTEERKFPGIVWLGNSVHSNPDGTLLFVIMKDEEGIAQIFSVSTTDGIIIKLTNNKGSVDTSFDISSDGRYLVYGIDESIYITAVIEAETFIILSKKVENKGLRGIHWSNDGKSIVYNRLISQRSEDYFQIFILK